MVTRTGSRKPIPSSEPQSLGDLQNDSLDRFGRRYAGHSRESRLQPITRRDAVEGVSVHRERIDGQASFRRWLGVSSAWHRGALLHCPHMDGGLLRNGTQICDRYAAASFVWLALRRRCLSDDEFHCSAALWGFTSAAPDHACFAHQCSAGSFNLHRATDLAPDAANVISNAQLAGAIV